jgi:hypothetical protein
MVMFVVCAFMCCVAMVMWWMCVAVVDVHNHGDVYSYGDLLDACMHPWWICVAMW